MIRALLFVLGTAFVLVSCAPNNIVALVADPDGHVGRIEVANAGGTQTLDTAKTAVDIDNATSRPTVPAPITDATIQEYWGTTIAAMPPRPVNFTLYFENGTATLTAESQQALPDVVARARNWPYPHIIVAGHTDAVGSDADNAVLSRQRADTVRALLITAGIAAPEIDAAGYGSGAPLVPTPRGVAEPRNRNVTVTIQ